MIKAVFFDIDGTLVSFKTHSVGESTRESIRRLRDKGIKVFIATGRTRNELDVLDGTTNKRGAFTGASFTLINVIPIVLGLSLIFT